jgi:hypothetical protein
MKSINMPAYLNNKYKTLLSFISVSLSDRIFRLITSQKLRRIKIQMFVHPCIINGQPALVYAQGLAEHNKLAFDELSLFAKTNGLKLKEDQRSSFKAVKQDRRGKIIPMMILGASLLTQNAFAITASENQLASELLNWINQHSSFDYSVDQIPKVKTVNARKIAAIAFGGALPKAVNPENLKIFGLYNFKEKTIYILETIDLNTEKGKAILLHELVHYIQYQSGKDKLVNCIKELEPKAYEIEEAYLNKHGIAVDLNYAGVCS